MNGGCLSCRLKHGTDFDVAYLKGDYCMERRFFLWRDVLPRVNPVNGLIVDLAEVKRFDSSAIAGIIVAYASMRKRGREFYLSRVSQGWENITLVHKLGDNFFPIRDIQ